MEKKLTELMGLDVAWGTILHVLMMVVTFVLYVPMNFIAKRLGKKKPTVLAFTFGITAFETIAEVAEG